MSEKKEYSPEEVARKIVDSIYGQLKKNEDKLAKAKNTAHEIENGGEPNDDNAECPASLAASGEFSQNSESSEGAEKGEYSEDESMEDEPLQGDSDSDSEEDEEKKKKKDSEESDEDDYEFKKSESGMHSVQYKRLAKGRMISDSEKRDLGYAKQNKKYQDHQEKIKGTKLDMEHPQHGDEKTRVKNISQQAPEKMAASEDGKKNPSFDREKKDVEWTGNQKKMINATKPGKIPSNRNDQAKFVEEAKQRRQKFREQGLLKEEVKETKGIKFDKEQISDKGAEEKKGIKRPMEKCGEVKKSKGVDKLKKFLGKEKQPSPGMVQEPQE